MSCLTKQCGNHSSCKTVVVPVEQPEHHLSDPRRLCVQEKTKVYHPVRKSRDENVLSKKKKSFALNVRDGHYQMILKIFYLY